MDIRKSSIVNVNVMSKNNLSIWLIGGLGNQLFMIFATMSYALDHSMTFRFISYKDKTIDGKRNTYWDTLLEGVKDFYGMPTQQLVKYDEPAHHYIPLPDELAQCDDCLLEGYFQSYKYFEHNLSKLSDILGLDAKIANVRQKYIQYFTNSKNIVMHFRLDDYIGLQAYHCIKKPDYYVNSLLALQRDLKKRGDDIGNYKILYFCQQNDDDIVNEFLRIIKDTSKGIPDLQHINYHFERIPDNIPDWEQMLLMSNCDHFIMANSSFSWWGTYLCNKPDKLVYYPRVWFGPALMDKKIDDLCPPSWTMIDS